MEQHSTARKAALINQDPQFYGTFAEIGAGQEVAREFFQAGLASHTIAKTISAYDMTFSDEIYGKGQRYVSEARVKKMLAHEFSLLQERLKDRRDTRFFVFADTVATSSRRQGVHSHGWLGVRFQRHPNGPTNDVLVHVELFDSNRLQQQQALGILGVNLLYATFYELDHPHRFLEILLEDIGSNRIEIDIVRFSGPDTQHVDNRLVSLQMVRKGLTEAAVFNDKSEVIQPADFLWGKAIVLQRGTYRPITTENLEILTNALIQLKNSGKCQGCEPHGLLEISMKNLEDHGHINEQDFLDRVDTLNTLGLSVMISNFVLFYEVKEFLRRCCPELLTMVIGASNLEKIFDESYYAGLEGGILNAFGKLFDDKTQIYVYPYKSEMLCTTAKTFHPAPHLQPLFQYLLQNKKIIDILGCDDVDTSIHSSDVRKLLAAADKSWEERVPAPVVALIKNRKLFGYHD